jgi:hypothetical protein
MGLLDELDNLHLFASRIISSRPSPGSGASTGRPFGRCAAVPAGSILYPSQVSDGETASSMFRRVARAEAADPDIIARRLPISEYHEPGVGISRALDNRAQLRGRAVSGRQEL